MLDFLVDSYIVVWILVRLLLSEPRDIMPQLWSESVNLYKDSVDMLKHLKTIYDDPNQVTTAKNQFQQLYMKTTDQFHDFLSEFLYLAAEAGVSDNNLKNELYYQITIKL